MKERPEKRLIVKEIKDRAGVRFFTKENDWGYSIGFLCGDVNNLKITGHMPGHCFPKKGDYYIHQCYEPESNRREPVVFEIILIERQYDPPDMFFGKVKDIGFVSDNKDKFPEIILQEGQ